MEFNWHQNVFLISWFLKSKDPGRIFLKPNYQAANNNNNNNNNNMGNSR